MYRKEALEEYTQALKEGQKEYKDCLQKKLPTHPEVLDEILPDLAAVTTVPVGLVEVPIHRVIGIKSAGRITAFTPSFRPLLEPDTEFGSKWISLCADHLGTTGIQNPIECFEYLGNFYIQEGNKRLSVLRHMGGSRILANVQRILPAAQDTPRFRAYQEFLDFYKLTGLYDIQFTAPGSYAKLLKRVGYPAQEPWTQEQRRRFQASYHYFTEALEAVGGSNLPAGEEALLLWLEVYPFSDLMELSATELKKTITQLWSNLLAASAPEPVVKTDLPEEKGVLRQILNGIDYLDVAFVHLYSPESSNWTRAHEAGRKHLDQVFGNAITTQSYFNANTPEQAVELIEQAVAGGAELVFTTAPQLISPCMKVSVKYPKVRFFNCSVHQPYATVMTYYSRIYEGKFITGAIAGAMCKDEAIGYVGSYPIHGVPASINAFALGVQMTNPKAKIELKWSCTPGNPTYAFLRKGIRVISNRDTPEKDHLVNDYGTYLADETGNLTSLCSPTWDWDQFYENVVRSIMEGNWDSEKEGEAVNLWWGMRSGVIDVKLSDSLPDGIRFLAETLKRDLAAGTLDPFRRRIVDQQGNVRNDGTKTFAPLELLKMDWLCENIVGTFPDYESIIPVARPMVDLLGVFPGDLEAL